MRIYTLEKRNYNKNGNKGDDFLSVSRQRQQARNKRPADISACYVQLHLVSDEKAYLRRRLSRSRTRGQLDERSRSRGPVDDSDVVLDAVAHEVGIGGDEGALVAEAPPPACLGKGRHRLALSMLWLLLSWGAICCQFTTESWRLLWLSYRGPHRLCRCRGHR